MKQLRVVVLVIFAACATASAIPAAGDWQRDAAVRDSLQQIEPWFRPTWLAAHGFQDYYRQHSFKPESSQGIRCVGRWSFGPSVKVDVRATSDDTIICLARGSGASLIRFRSHDSLTLDLLSDINCSGVLSRAVIRDTLVYCGMSQGGTGIEVWGVSDLTAPHRLSYVYLSTVMDIAVKDSFLYAIGYQQDSLRIFNVADPRNPVQVGACADSGFSMCASGDYVYLAHQYGLYIVDVSNPANPHRAGSIGGDQALSVAVRDSICFFGTASNGLRIYNVSNPVAPTLLGSLPGIQPADLYLPPTCDTVLYSPVFHAINIADLHNPRIIGQVSLPGWDYGVTAVPALNYALVADYFDGLVAVNLASTSAPVMDTSVFAAGTSNDICVDSQRAYVSQYFCGMRIVDVSDPTAPRTFGVADTTGYDPSTYTLAAADSFAYVGWSPRPYFRSFGVASPTAPVQAGGCELTNPPQDMALRDTLVYVAENARFQVVNVARPREPVLVGSCVLPFDSHDMDIEDTLAFVGNTTSLQIVNVARPANPVVVGEWGTYTTGVDVVDTIAYVACSFGFAALNVANPSSPYVIDSLDTGIWPWDVVVAGHVAYVGTKQIQAVDVSDPRNLRIAGQWSAPDWVQRLCYAAPFVYAACQEGGVCILDTLDVGIAEQTDHRPGEATVRVVPSVTGGLARLILPQPIEAQEVRIYSVSGGLVRHISAARVLASRDSEMPIDLSGLPEGVYVLTCRVGGSSSSAKVTKLQRR